MVLANPLWGSPRIHGELLKLGLEVSQDVTPSPGLRKQPQPGTYRDWQVKTWVGAALWRRSWKCSPPSST